MDKQKPSLKKENKPERPLKNPEKEINGFESQGLLEPTRYGDWDVKGRCSDF